MEYYCLISLLSKILLTTQRKELVCIGCAVIIGNLMDLHIERVISGERSTPEETATNPVMGTQVGAVSVDCLLSLGTVLML